MNILVVGSGGREHALAWKIAQSTEVEKVYCAPGNPGMAALEKGVCLDIGVNDFDGLKRAIGEHDIALTVVGPEDPLTKGIHDALSRDGHLVFGPTAAAAQIEGSKQFAKDFMARHKIPTAAHAVFDDADAAADYVKERGVPIVVKADGLAAGKGVTVAHDLDAALAAVREAMVGGRFGEAGRRVVVEDCLHGEEASILAFCDGERAVPLVSSQDHKPAFDGDKGPNTGGMGAYAPAPIVTSALAEEIQKKVLDPCVRGMAAEGTPYKGILYAGLMIGPDGPQVVEFNCRFGDPETQAVLPQLKSDIVPILIASCEGRLGDVQLAYEDQATVTVVMASGGYPGDYEKGKVITGIEAAEAEAGVQVFHASTKQTEAGLVTNGGRVLNVTASAGALSDAIEKAYAAVEKIRFDGAHFRRDIGHKALKQP